MAEKVEEEEVAVVDEDEVEDLDQQQLRPHVLTTSRCFCSRNRAVKARSEIRDTLFTEMATSTSRSTIAGHLCRQPLRASRSVKNISVVCHDVSMHVTHRGGELIFRGISALFRTG